MPSAWSINCKISFGASGMVGGHFCWLLSHMSPHELGLNSMPQHWWATPGSLPCTKALTDRALESSNLIWKCESCKSKVNTCISEFFVKILGLDQVLVLSSCKPVHKTVPSIFNWEPPVAQSASVLLQHDAPGAPHQAHAGFLSYSCWEDLTPNCRWSYLSLVHRLVSFHQDAVHCSVSQILLSLV